AQAIDPPSHGVHHFKERVLKDIKKSQGKNLLIWVGLALALFFVFNMTNNQAVPQAKTLGYSEFVQKVHRKEIQSLTMEGKSNIVGVTKEGARFKVYAP